MGIASCSLRCRQWTIERGIRCRIRTDKVVEGRAHGRALQGTNLLRNQMGLAWIRRRGLETDPWADHSQVDADGYGHWTSLSLQILRDDGATDFYDYKVGEDELGWAFVREYIVGDAKGAYPVWLMADQFGLWYRALCIGTTVRVDRRGGPLWPWQNGIWTVQGVGSTHDPWVDKVGSELICCWRDDDGYHRITSLDDGASTTGEATIMAAGDTAYVSHIFGGVQYVVSSNGGSLYLQRFVAGTGTLLVFSDASTKKLIAAGDFAGFWIERGDLIVQVSDDTTWCSYDGGETFVERTNG